MHFTQSSSGVQKQPKSSDIIKWNKMKTVDRFVSYILCFVCFLAMSDDHITAYKANIHIHVWNA